MTVKRTGVAFLLATACATQACSQSESLPSTQIMVIIDGDGMVRRESDEVQVVLRGSKGADVEETVLVYGDDEAIGWPRRVAVVPENGDASRTLEVTVTAYRDGEEARAAFVEARAITEFVPDRRIALRLQLTSDCVDRLSCNEDETCMSGNCVPARVEDPKALPDYDPDAEAPQDASALDAGLDAGFDTGLDTGDGPDSGNSNVERDASAEAGYDAAEPCDEPGEHRCTGATLERCTADGGVWREVQTCMSEARCHEGVQTGECKICAPHDVSCFDDTTRHVCGSNGKTLTMEPCPSETPYCVNDGACVACRDATDCPASDECDEPACEAGQCSERPLSQGTTCSDGVCDGQGNCVDCIENADCEPMQCRSADCASNTCTYMVTPGASCGTDKYCSTAGDCGECAPGTSDCQGSTPRTCSDAAQWIEQSTCNTPSQLCRDGSCVDNPPYEVGNDTQLPDEGTEAGNYLVGFRIQVPRRAALLDFGMFSRESGSGPLMKMALYDDAAGEPGALITQTGSSSIDDPDSEGRVEIPPQTSVTLDAGYYWVMTIFDGNADTYWDANQGPASVSLAHDYNDALPDPYDTTSAQTVSGYSYNYYIRVQDVQ